MYLKEESPPLREISSKELVEVIFGRAQLPSVHSALGLLRAIKGRMVLIHISQEVCSN